MREAAAPRPPTAGRSTAAPAPPTADRVRPAAVRSRPPGRCACCARRAQVVRPTAGVQRIRWLRPARCCRAGRRRRPVAAHRWPGPKCGRAHRLRARRASARAAGCGSRRPRPPRSPDSSAAPSRSPPAAEYLARQWHPARQRQQFSGAAADQRVRDRVQPGARVVVGEGSGRQRGPVQTTVGGQNIGAEGLDQSGEPSVPGATTSRAIASESITTAPRSARIRATVDLPAPMPPVRPIRNIRPVSHPGGRAPIRYPSTGGAATNSGCGPTTPRVNRGRKSAAPHGIGLRFREQYADHAGYPLPHPFSPPCTAIARSVTRPRPSRNISCRSRFPSDNFPTRRAITSAKYTADDFGSANLRRGDPGQNHQAKEDHWAPVTTRRVATAWEWREACTASKSPPSRLRSPSIAAHGSPR